MGGGVGRRARWHALALHYGSAGREMPPQELPLSLTVEAPAQSCWRRACMQETCRGHAAGAAAGSPRPAKTQRYSLGDGDIGRAQRSRLPLIGACPQIIGANQNDYHLQEGIW